MVQSISEGQEDVEDVEGIEEIEELESISPEVAAIIAIQNSKRLQLLFQASRTY